MLLVIDSGLGGCNSLNAMLSQHPKLPFVFLGDTEWVPYGDKDPELIKDRVLYLVNTVGRQYDITAVAIACNTAVCALLGDHTDKDLMQDMLGLPVFSVIHETVDRVRQEVPLEQPLSLCATPATVNHGLYGKLLLEAGYKASLRALACPLWAPLIEKESLDSPKLENAIKEGLAPFQEQPPETLILGCTHYTAVLPLIQAVLPHTQLIDSSTTLAQRLDYSLFNLTEDTPQQHLIVTASPDEFERAISNLPLTYLWNRPVKACISV